MSHFLYDLIKSLTTSEKAYFKRHVKIHAGKGDKNYLKIYDTISKLKTYDKTVLPNLFKGTTIEKHQSSEVKYLNDKILLSLFNYNLNKSKRNQIHKDILILEALASKGFKKEALKKLKVLKKNALKYEEFTFVLRLIELEEISLFKQGIMGFKAQLEELNQQRIDITNIINNINRYHLLRQEVRELQFNEHLLNPDIKQELLIKYDDQTLVKNKAKCLSKKATEHWYYINVLSNYLQLNFEAGLRFSDAYVNFIIENNHLFDSSSALPALSNYIYHAALTGNRSHFEKGRDLLQSFSNKKGVSEHYLNYILYTRHLEFAYQTNDLKLLQEYQNLIITLTKNNLNEFEEPQIHYLYLNIIKSAIVLNDHSVGMHFSNLWHQRGVLDYRKVQARLLSIILHFEVNYTELVLSEIITLKKLLKNNAREKDLINCFYTFFNSILKHPERSVTLIQTLQQELKTLSKNPNTQFSFVNFNYYEWSLKLSVK
jgi:hypothetical protein